MSFLSGLFGEQEKETQEKDFNLINAQLEVYQLVAGFGCKKEINEKLYEYLAFRQLSKVLDSVPDNQLEKIITFKGCEEHRELIETISHAHYKHEEVEKFIDLFQNGKAEGVESGTVKLIHSRDHLGINNITLL